MQGPEYTNTINNSNIPVASIISRELINRDPEVTRTGASTKEGIRAFSTMHSKIFTPHSFIKFVTKSVIMDQNFAEFTVPN